jgi:hypothetical protein
MSTTFDLVCHDCKQRIWIGQGHYIYKTDDDLTALEAFLFAHRRHKLEFVSEHDKDLSDYVCVNLDDKDETLADDIAAPRPS